MVRIDICRIWAGQAMTAVLAVLSTACFSPATAAGQQQPATGQVLDAATGRPVPGAIVVGIASDSSAINTVLTDGDGRYTLRYPDTAPPSAVRVERIGYTAQIFVEPEYSG